MRDRRPTWPGHRMPGRGAVLGLILLGVMILTGCASDAPLDMLDPKGPQAKEIDGLWDIVFAIAVVVFVLVQAGIIFMMVKFRRRDDDDELPNQVHGNFALEIGWTILPAIVLAVVSVLTVSTLFNLEDRDDNAMPVRVIGQQWWWEFQYDVNEDGLFTVDDPSSGDFRTVGEMVIPAGRQIDLSIESYDVIHSFWIPALNGKKDAVPGRVHNWSLEADEPGEYKGTCTEFCGLSHSRMRMSVQAVTPAEFDTWVAHQGEGADFPDLQGVALSEAEAGREIFAANCSSCHQVRGEWGNEENYGGSAAQVSGNAPELTHFMSRSTFAGSIFDLYDRGPTGPDGIGDLGTPYVGLSPETAPLNRIQLEKWISNAPAEKAMASEPISAEDSRTGEAIPGRGMPAFTSLTREQVDQLVAYLSTLD